MENKTIEECLAEAYDALSAAQIIADEEGSSFYFDLAYGMGGTYYSPKRVEESVWLQSEYGLDPAEGGWVASSQTC